MKKLQREKTQNSASNSLNDFSKRLRVWFLTAVVGVTTALGFVEAIYYVNSVESIAQAVAASQLESQTVEKVVVEVEEIKVIATENDDVITKAAKELLNSPTATLEEIKPVLLVWVKQKIAPAVGKTEEVSLESEEDLERMLNYRGIRLVKDDTYGIQVIVNDYRQPGVEISSEKHFYERLMDTELLAFLDAIISIKTDAQAKKMLNEMLKNPKFREAEVVYRKNGSRENLELKTFA